MTCQVIPARYGFKGPIGCPIAQNTRLGWILSGQISESSKTEPSCRNIITTLHTQVVEEEFDLKRFWDIESDQCLLNKHQHTPEEQKCEEFFKHTTTRDPSGRYIMKLPFKEENPNCKSGNSREIAVSRFLMQERHLSKSPNLKDLYSDVIAEYLELGHMEKVPNDEIDKTESVYLPHHAVVIKLNRTTTKLRVVFDASCRDKNGVSLNSELLVGPRLQSDLRHLAMKWRLHPSCLVADIVKMYHQIISTLLYQIEACLNSRPLSQISTNSQDPTPLTPGHFIIGEPLVLVPDNNYETSTISSLKRWQLTQQMLQVFWRRWSNEYLTQFLQRYKWANKTPEPRIGDVVLVKEDDLAPAKWLMGIITEKHKGLDNLTRVVSIKCRDTIIKRPVVKLCVLPVAE